MKRALKWIGLVLGGLVVLLLVVGLVLYFVGGSKLSAQHEVATASLSIPADSASLARGAHLAGIYGCLDCHGEDLGGNEMEDAPPFRLVASNLTPGGPTAEYSPEDWDRAIRHGVRPDGTAMFVMPSGAYNKMADDEVAALISYLQSIDPIENDMTGVEWKPMGQLLAAGPLDLSTFVYPESGPVAAPEADSTVAYGAYVSGMMCAYCHGENLEGKMPDGPSQILAPDLRASAQWPRGQFHQSLTTGTLPTGRTMNPEVMPWNSTARMTFAEREGVRRYLAQLGPAPEADTDT